MKHLRLYRSIVLITLASVSFGAVQEGTIIRRVLKANDKRAFNVVSETRMTADLPTGSQDGSFKSTGQLETSIGAVKADGSSADYTMVTTVDHLDSDGFLAMQKSPEKVPPVTIKGTIDSQNRIADSKVVGSADAAGPMSILGGSEASQLGLFVTFPATSVKNGDSWTVAVPSSVMNKDAQTLKATLIGTQDFNGTKVLAIKMTGHLVIEPDAEAMKKAASGQENAMNMNVKLKGAVDVDSDILLDPATGDTVQTISKIKGKFNIEIVEISTTFPATLDTSVKLTRKS